MCSAGPRAIFGDRTSELSEAIVDSVRDTHDRHAAAQDLIDATSQRAYGSSMWATLPKDLCAAVSRGFLDATSTVCSGGGYSVPVLNGCLIYVWRPAGGKSPDEAEFFTSGVRDGLFDVHARQTTLFEDLGADPSAGGPDLEELVDEADAQQQTVVLVAVTARSERLHVIEWGQIKKSDDDQLVWIGREVIFRFEEDTYRPMPVTTRTFADGQPPSAIVTPRIEVNDE